VNVDSDPAATAADMDEGERKRTDADPSAGAAAEGGPDSDAELGTKATRCSNGDGRGDEMGDDPVDDEGDEGAPLGVCVFTGVGVGVASDGLAATFALDGSFETDLVALLLILLLAVALTLPTLLTLLLLLLLLELLACLPLVPKSIIARGSLPLESVEVLGRLALELGLGEDDDDADDMLALEKIGAKCPGADEDDESRPLVSDSLPPLLNE